MTDADGVSTDVYFRLSVTSADFDPPAVDAVTASPDPVTSNSVTLSVTPGAASAGSGLSYEWSVLRRPAEAALPTFSAQAQSTVATFQAAGTYVFRVKVTDGNLRSTVRDVAVQVEATPTTIQFSKPGVTVQQGGTTELTATLLDQFGKPVDTNPSTAGVQQPIFGLSITGAGNAYEEADTVAADGTQLIQVLGGSTPGVYTLTASSAVTGGATGALEVVVPGANDDPPTVAFTNAPASISGSRVTLTAAGSDDGGAANLTYAWEVYDSQAGVQRPHIDVLARDPANPGVSRAVVSFAAPGAYTIRVIAVDGVEQKTAALHTINVTASQGSMSITPGSVALNQNGTYQFKAEVRDQFGTKLATQPAVTWSVVESGGGDANFNGTAGLYKAPAGAGEYHVKATSGALTATALVRVALAAAPVARIVHLDPPPVAPSSEFKSDAGAALISADTKVSIVVDDPNDDLASYTLKLIPQGREGVTVTELTLASGTTEVGADGNAVVVATLRPGQLTDGVYTLELRAQDSSGSAPTIDRRTIQVRSDVKLGNFALPATDLSVQTGGIPIVIGRVYDSNDAGRDRGDFGYGWRLTTNDTNLDGSNRGRPLTSSYSRTAAPSFYTGEWVSFTLPSGETHAFRFDPRPPDRESGGVITGDEFTPAFVPANGTTATLTVSQTDSYNADINLRTTNLGEVYSQMAGGEVQVGYNPALDVGGEKIFGNWYELKTRDGTTYHINATSGRIEWTMDANGNELKFSSEGGNDLITSSTDPNSTVDDVVVTLFRTGGKITSAKVTKAAVGGGREVLFQYDGASNLSAVIDLVGNATHYRYSDKHMLEKVVDPRGLPVVTVKYTADGRMERMTDSRGKYASFGQPGFDGASAAQPIQDLAGNDTSVTYDHRGNPIREIREVRNPGGVSRWQVTVRKFDYGFDAPHHLSEVTEYQAYTVDTLEEAHDEDSAPALQLQSHARYDSKTGDLVEQTDAAGRTTILYYENESAKALGKPSKVKDAYGKFTHFVHDSKGNVLETTNALGEKTKFDYDARGNVTATYQHRNGGWQQISGATFGGPDGRMDSSSGDYFAVGSGPSLTWQPRSRREYGSVTVTVDGKQYLKETVTRKWRDNGTAAWESFVESRTLTDALGRVFQVEDADGKTTTTLYNSNGQVETETDKYGGVTSYTYDAHGNAIRTRYADGTEIRTAYDLMGRAELVTDQYKTVSASDNATKALATRTIYDSAGRVVATVRVKDALVKIEDETFTGTGVLGTGTLTLSKSLTASYGAELSRSSITYDDTGRVKSTTGPGNPLTEYTYHADGSAHETKVGSPSGLFNTTEHIRDENFADGRQKTVKDARGNGTVTHYDELGQVVKVVRDNGTETPADDLETTTQYSDFGRHVVKKDEQGVATDYHYDAEGRLTSVVMPDPDGAGPLTVATWSYEYDGQGNQVKIVDPRSTTAHPIVTSFTYDAQGRRLSRTLPEGQIEEWKYEDGAPDNGLIDPGFGRLRVHKDFKGRHTRYAYFNDGPFAGKVKEELRYDVGQDPYTGTYSEKTVYTYDALGRSETVTEYAGASKARTVKYVYDPVTGGVTQRLSHLGNKTVGVDAPDEVLNHAYDSATGLLTKTFTTKTETRYAYDTLNRLEAVTSFKRNGENLATPEVTRYSYDEVGNIKSVTLPNGVVTTYVYDNFNRLDLETVAKVTGASTTAIAEYDYVLEPDGQRRSVTETKWDAYGLNPVSTTTDWSYDLWNRLVGEGRDAGNDGQDGNDYFTSYSYDLVGNRLEQFVDNATGPDRRTLYRYGEVDAAGDLTTPNGNDWLGWVIEEDGAGVELSRTQHSYDANGSLVNKTSTGSTPSVTNYSYDLRNRMIAADTNGNGAFTDAGDLKYGYDSDGIRVSNEVVGASATSYLVDDNNPTGYAQVLEESTTTASGTTLRTYVLGNDVVSQADGANPSLHLLYDGHGSTRGLLNSAGAVIEAYDYDAFGKALVSNPASPGTSLLYAGEQFDGGLNEYYLRARYYDQNLGRFTSFDAFEGESGSPLSLHKYAYTHNDPANLLDPSGHMVAAETFWVATKQLGLRIADAGLRVLPTGLALSSRAAYWVLTNQLKIEFYLLVGGLALSAGAQFADYASTTLLENMDEPVPDKSGSIGEWIEEKVGANATEYEVIDDDRGGMQTSIKSKAVKAVNAIEIDRLQRHITKEVNTLANRKSPWEPKHDAPPGTAPRPLAPGRQMICPIPQTAASVLQNPGFRTFLRNLQQTSRVAIRVVPINRWKR